MRTRSALVLCGVAALGSVWAPTAGAQDATSAGALFDKGVADMQAHHFESGCPALEESERLDPHAGTLFTLAECDAKWGKVASAVTRYQDYLGVVTRLSPEQQARHGDRVRVAKEQLKKLAPSVPTLTLILPTDAPLGTSVLRNGVALQGAAIGTALPIDPGSYLVATQVPGAAPESITVEIALGDAKRVTLQIRRPVVTPVAASGSLTAANARESDVTEPSVPARDSASPTRGIAYVAGGIGVAGIVAGSVTGLMVLGKRSTVNHECVDHACSDAGLKAEKDGKNLALVSDFGFGLGVAGLASAAILFLTQSGGASAASSQSQRWDALLTGTPSGAFASVRHRW